MATLTPEAALQAIFGETPQSAIEWLSQRTRQPSEAWYQVLDDAHNRAFVIARMAHLDLLNDVQQSLIKAMELGQDFKAWREQIEPAMRSRGWWGKQILIDEGGVKTIQLGSPARLQTIYRTNTLQAYEAGRQRVMFSGDDNDPFPYVMYSEILDSRTRPRHRALHGVVMRKDDPAWAAIRPKNGYNCRCTVIEMTTGQVERGGYQVDTSAGHLSTESIEVGKQPDGTAVKATVTTLRLPGRPTFQTDPGWNTSPNQLLMPQLLTKAEQSIPIVAARTVSEVLGQASAMQQLANDFKQWVEPIIAQIPPPGAAKTSMRLEGKMMHVGCLSPEVILALEEQGQQVKSAILTVRDDDVVHALRPSKHNPVDRDWYVALPEHLAQPQAVLLDLQKEAPSLLFVYPVAGNERIKVAVMVNYQVKGKMVDTGIKTNLTTNIVRTTQIVQNADLKTKSYQLLLGEI